MRHWEYRLLHMEQLLGEYCGKSREDIQDIEGLALWESVQTALNRAGAQGWRVVQILAYETGVLLARPIETDSTEHDASYYKKALVVEYA